MINTLIKYPTLTMLLQMCHRIRPENGEQGGNPHISYSYQHSCFQFSVVESAIFFQTSIKMLQYLEIKL